MTLGIWNPKRMDRRTTLLLDEELKNPPTAPVEKLEAMAREFETFLSDVRKKESTSIVTHIPD